MVEQRLLTLMADGATGALPEEEFTDLAIEVFRYQVRANPVYGRFVRGRGLDPESVRDWGDIPPVPTRAFEELDLFCGDPAEAEAVFLTSGTSRGTERRGRHPVRSLALYRASLLSSAAAHLRPEAEDEGPGAPPLRVLALTPPPGERPDSSLAYMVGTLARAWDETGGGFFADAEWRIQDERLHRSLAESADGDVPVLVVGTAFAFVHWTDRVRAAGRPVALPEASRILETGGFKGRSREVSRMELYEAMEEVFDVPVRRIVNEYGMTELLSQFYEPVLREGGPGEPDRRRHVAPPWVRTRILDPRDLSPAPRGTPGILAHLDLANLHSVAAVLTEDRGVEVEGGFRILGRTAGAEPRGCSLTMEELLEARGARGR